MPTDTSRVVRLVRDDIATRVHVLASQTGIPPR